MLIVFILYLLVLIGITIYSAGRSKNTSEYVLGGKKISGIVLALSERSTGESVCLHLKITGDAFDALMSVLFSYILPEKLKKSL